MAFTELIKSTQRERYDQDCIHLGAVSGRISLSLLREMYDGKEPSMVTFLYDKELHQLGLMFGFRWSKFTNGYRISKISGHKSKKSTLPSKTWRFFATRHLHGREGVRPFESKGYKWIFRDGMFIVQLESDSSEETDAN
jgi:hypothetical protein